MRSTNMGKVHTSNNANSWGFSYDFSVAKPMDTRTVVATYSDLTNADIWKQGGAYMNYKGMTVACADTGKIYVYIGETASAIDVAKKSNWVAQGSDVENSLDSEDTDVALSAAMGKKLNDSINQLKEYREVSIDFGKNEDSITIAIMQPSIISSVKLVNVKELYLSYDGHTQQKYESGQVDLGDSDYLVLEVTRDNDAKTAVVGLTLKNK